MTSSRLEQILAENESIRSIDQLMPSLAAFRDHYALIFDSQSAQQDRTKPQAPRTILFGGDALFVMAYTGCPTAEESQKPFSNAETIETLEYDLKKELFVLKEIKLSGAKYQSGKSFQISEINPSRCLHCHGDPPRAIWEPYPKWHGVYGSLSDPEAGINTLDTNSKEVDDYHAFRKRTLSNPNQCPRYSKLKWNEEDITGVMLSHGSSNRVNEDLNQLLQELNLRSRLVHLLNSPIYQKYRYALFEALSGLNCTVNKEQDWSQRFLPKTRDRTLPTFDQNFNRITKIHLKERLPFLDSKEGIPAKEDPLRDDQVTAFLAKLDTIFAREGEHLRGWSTSFDERFNIATPGLILPAINKFYMEWVKHCDPIALDFFENVTADLIPPLGENTYNLSVLDRRGVHFKSPKELCVLLEKKNAAIPPMGMECLDASPAPVRPELLNVFDEVGKTF